MRYYLFPFDQVEKGFRIIIYGAGKIGVQFVEQIKSLNYCDCLFFVDRNFKEIQYIHGIEVRDPKCITETEYDKIVIASVGSSHSIYDILINLNVPKEKIVSKFVAQQYLEEKLQSPADVGYNAGWDRYYESAENVAKNQFNRYFIPILSRYNDISLEKVLDFACGRGRIANIFSSRSENITCCDTNPAAIDFCKDRFGGNKNCSFEFIVNNTINNSLEQLCFKDNSFSFIYSWDAMVHFSYKWLDFYIKEFFRILSNNSYAFIHHSNFGNTQVSEIKSEDWTNNPNGRAHVTTEDVKFIAQNHGFSVVDQKTIDWGIPNLDCISLLKKQ